MPLQYKFPFIYCWMLHCFAFEEKEMEGIDWAYEGLRQEASEFDDEFSPTW